MGGGGGLGSHFVKRRLTIVVAAVFPCFFATTCQLTSCCCVQDPAPAVAILSAALPDVAALLTECVQEDGGQRPGAVEARDRVRAAMFAVALRTWRCALRYRASDVWCSLASACALSGSVRRSLCAAASSHAMCVLLPHSRPAPRPLGARRVCGGGTGRPAPY